jgi:hypothetical protein
MMGIMRTTVNIDAELLKTARIRARERGITLGQFLEDAVRRSVATEAATKVGPPIPVFRGGTGLRPGVDLSSNRAIYELLDEGVELDKLR